MNFLRQYRDLVSMELRSMRAEVPIIAAVQIGFMVGFVFGFGYLIPEVSDATAAYIVTGTATQGVVTIGLVMLPQLLAQSKHDGRLDYYLAMPISREAYLLALVTVTAVMALPAVALCLALGALRYDIALDLHPLLPAALLLGIGSLAGVGIAMATYAPHQQVTNALTQLIIFYVLFFAPVLMPREQLPGFLRETARIAPPTYVADAIRATATNLSGTHLGTSLVAMTAFAAASLLLSAIAIRRRG
ncbi:ABC transporter permease [Tepidiforma sp.]|uniref:ABC transporter permease n=1 Tax=Tepidiforma sp. TaxID=2682230 RepID=UPI002ADDAFBD|nr:ABC transporter permease [Tepidiforma sp.]